MDEDADSGARQVSPTNRDAASRVEVHADDVLARVDSMTTGSDARAESLQDFMAYVIQDAANVWTWYYQQWGEGYPEVSSVNWSFLDENTQVETKCVNARGSVAVADHNSVFYCSTDDTIYFGFTAARRLWNGSMTGPLGLRAPGGDYALAAVLAHEYGHNVQVEMGVTRKQIGGPVKEQMADCLSGAFTQVAAYQGILEEGDVEEGWMAIEMYGDDGSGNDPHGSPEERRDAFAAGWESAGPVTCWNRAGLS